MGVIDRSAEKVIEQLRIATTMSASHLGQLDLDWLAKLCGE